MAEINTNLDTTPLPPNNLVAQDQQSAELAGYVRTKTFGRDVREAIARSIELNSTRSKSAEVLAQETLQVTNRIKEDTATATSNMANQVELIRAEKDAVIANATVDSEVILARGGKATLGQRLDEIAGNMPVFAEDYGVSYENISTVNSDALDAALAVALAENRELKLPIAPTSDTYIRVARGIVVDKDNFKISGYGRLTRIRMMVPATQFVTLNGNNSVAEGFDVIGTEYPDGVSGDIGPGSVAVQVTGDYCTVNDVQGDVLMSLVRVYDDGGKLIESPKVTNIKSGHNVAFGLLASHTNNLIYDNVTGSYSYHKGRGEPPHLIYVDHTHGPNRNLQGGYAYAENGTGSFAFQFKGCIGGNAGHLVAKSCEGVYHVMDSERFGVKEIYSEDDQWDNLTSGAITLRATDSNIKNKNLSIDKAYVEVKNAKGFYSIYTDDSMLKNITVIDTRDVYGEAYAPFHLGFGDNNQVINPHVENNGSIMSATTIWITNGKHNIVDNPTTKGNASSVLFDTTNTGVNKLINYDLSKQTAPANIRYATIVTPDNSVDTRTAKSLIAHTDVLSHWDGSQYRFVDSGQPFEWVSGVFKGNVTDGYLYSDSQATKGNIGVVDTGMTDIQVSGDVYYKTDDALVLRVVDVDNYLDFKFYGNNVLLRAKRGGEFVHLSQIPFPGGGNIGRLYNFKASIYGDRIECYIDGVRYIDHTLTTEDATLFGTATKFGIFGQGTGGKWTNLRWVKLK